MEGAGCKEVNGFYARDGSYKGHAQYTKKDGLQLWWNKQWRIGRSNGEWVDRLLEMLRQGAG